jgi:DNA repair protein RecO (recombination protein O)
MDWRDDGIVLTVRPLGEGATVVEALTRRHGRHLGLVRGGGSRRMAGVLEPGNLVRLSWRARLTEQLGAYSVEPGAAWAASLFHDRIKLAVLSSATALASVTLPEREPHQRIFDALESLLTGAAVSSPLQTAAEAAAFELALLEDLGFGLDLSACAATGATGDLSHVSPKSGRAVSAAAAAPYRERLLRLPGFLIDTGAPLTWSEVADALILSGFFLERLVLLPHQKQPPPARIRLAEMIVQSSVAF